MADSPPLCESDATMEFFATKTSPESSVTPSHEEFHSSDGSSCVPSEEGGDCGVVRDSHSFNNPVTIFRPKPLKVSPVQLNEGKRQAFNFKGLFILLFISPCKIKKIDLLAAPTVGQTCECVKI